MDPPHPVKVYPNRLDQIIKESWKMPHFNLPKLAGEKLEEKFKIRRASDCTSFFHIIFAAVDFGLQQHLPNNDPGLPAGQ